VEEYNTRTSAEGQEIGEEEENIFVAGDWCNAAQRAPNRRERIYSTTTRAQRATNFLYTNYSLICARHMTGGEIRGHCDAHIAEADWGGNQMVFPGFGRSPCGAHISE